MPNNNPDGVNQSNVHVPERKYGEVAALQRLKHEVPIATPPAVNAPRRAQRKATRRPRLTQPQPVERPPGEMGDEMMPPTTPDQAPPQAASAFWLEAANIPGVTPTVRELVQNMGGDEAA